MMVWDFLPVIFSGQYYQCLEVSQGVDVGVDSVKVVKNGGGFIFFGAKMPTWP